QRSLLFLDLVGLQDILRFRFEFAFKLNTALKTFFHFIDLFGTTLQTGNNPFPDELVTTENTHLDLVLHDSLRDLTTDDHVFFLRHEDLKYPSFAHLHFDDFRIQKPFQDLLDFFEDLVNDLHRSDFYAIAFRMFRYFSRSIDMEGKNHRHTGDRHIHIVHRDIPNATVDDLNADFRRFNLGETALNSFQRSFGVGLNDDFEGLQTTLLDAAHEFDQGTLAFGNLSLGLDLEGPVTGGFFILHDDHQFS